MTNNVTKLAFPLKESMSVKQFKLSLQEVDWEHVIAIGYDKDGELVSRCSEMSKQDALWLFEVMKNLILNE
jgi:ribosome maturation factor RimP